MNCPCCNAKLPIDQTGQLDICTLKDMIRRVEERKHYLMTEYQWFFDTAKEQAVKEIFYGEKPIP